MPEGNIMTFKVLKEEKKKTCQLTILYLTKFSFRIEGENKCFSDKQKIKEFIFIKLN